jgi:hypothetical protein
VNLFEQTCYKPYDRHLYRLIFSNGKSKVFDDYMDVQATWLQTPKQFLSHVEILDKKTKKASRGFGG